MGIDRLLLVTGKMVGKALKSKVVSNTVNKIGETTGLTINKILDNELESADKMFTEILQEPGKIYLNRDLINKMFKFIENTKQENVLSLKYLFIEYIAYKKYITRDEIKEITEANEVYFIKILTNSYSQKTFNILNKIDDYFEKNQKIKEMLLEHLENSHAYVQIKLLDKKYGNK